MREQQDLQGSTTPDAKDRDQLSPENMQFLRQYIERESGIALGDSKQYLLQSRLQPIVSLAKLTSLGELCDQLRGSPAPSLRRLVVEAITTHETLFFRDIGVFDCLRTALLPEIARQHGTTKSIRIWSAACSSGQEAYSVAMLLLESGYANWNIQILGTDLSSRILERASTGKFLQIEVNRGMPAALLVKYFQRAGKEWQVKDPVRRMVSFAPFDLRQDMRSLGSFDLVLCRNVLIYFDVETRKKILAAIRGTLFPGGYLLLGSSETTFNLDEGYLRKTVGEAIVYQKPMMMAASGSL
jgi:chemotaxis protein methyltransferase CheR